MTRVLRGSAGRRLRPVYGQGRAARLLAAIAQILASTVAIVVVVTR